MNNIELKYIDNKNRNYVDPMLIKCSLKRIKKSTKDIHDKVVKSYPENLRHYISNAFSSNLYEYYKDFCTITNKDYNLESCIRIAMNAAINKKIFQDEVSKNLKEPPANSSSLTRERRVPIELRILEYFLLKDESKKYPIKIDEKSDIRNIVYQAPLMFFSFMVLYSKIKQLNISGRDFDFKQHEEIINDFRVERIKVINIAHDASKNYSARIHSERKKIDFSPGIITNGNVLKQDVLNFHNSTRDRLEKKNIDIDNVPITEKNVDVYLEAYTKFKKNKAADYNPLDEDDSKKMYNRGTILVDSKLLLFAACKYFYLAIDDYKNILLLYNKIYKKGLDSFFNCLTDHINHFHDDDKISKIKISQHREIMYDCARKLKFFSSDELYESYLQKIKETKLSPKKKNIVSNFIRFLRNIYLPVFYDRKKDFYEISMFLLSLDEERVKKEIKNKEKNLKLLIKTLRNMGVSDDLLNKHFPGKD